ncbi:low-density lipoprotein receptor-related protein 12-like [Haliotis rufescens]|uniref:low-density lipoprotein receptor-related protein 12-like n=1 Tax=Haliotis rufescens TaxID=6454 RepID=UPI001EB09438|nr:low-density lipoprotein receptor-related protein 12-like [Haliotis rufescens]
MPRIAITCVVFICFLPGMTHVSGCSSTLTGYSGFFTSPNYPGNYPSNADCYYTIDAGNKPIRLLFLDFGVEVGYDIVKVYDGSSTLLSLLDGSRGMYVIEPATHYTVHFQSDDLLNYRGFNATWTISATALASDVPALVHGRCSYQEDVVRQSSSGFSLSYLELLSTVTIFDCLFVCREDSLCTAFHYLNQGCTLYFNFVCNDTLPALLYVGM